MIVWISCFDIGGTTIKYGLCNEEGVLTERSEIPTEIMENGPHAMLMKVADIANIHKSSHDVAGVAIATAGIVDTESGTILYGGNNFPGYEGINIKEVLTSMSGLPCSVENDVNCVALGEYWKGAGQRSRSLFCLTVGTGIGGAAMIDGKLYHGASYCAGEIGFMKIGSSTSFEGVASMKALIENVARARQISPKDIDGKKIFKQAKSGDAVANLAIQRMVDHLAAGMADICDVYNPDMVIIGGGVSAQMRYIRPMLMKSLEKQLIPPIYENTRITFANLQNDAGMIGAVYHFLHEQSM